MAAPCVEAVSAADKQIDNNIEVHKVALSQFLAKISGADGSTCEVDGCLKRSRARGKCAGHYAKHLRQTGERVRRGGGRPRRFSADDAERVIAEALTAQADECIDWPWSRTVKEYGRLYDGSGGYEEIHRRICRTAHGEPPEGKEARHSCGRACCINPRHLSWQTHKRNMFDKFEHGTMPVKLSEAVVRRIRRLPKSSKMYAVLGERYGVDSETIRAAAEGRTWKHVA